VGNTVQSVERAAAVLELLAGTPGDRGVTELAHTLGLPKSTVHGILRTLEGVGLVERDRGTGRYRVERRAGEPGSPAIDVHVLRSLAMNWLDALAVRCGHSVRLAVPVQGRAVVVHHVFRPDDSRQVLEVGEARPVHACAMGKVLLAGGCRLDVDLRSLTSRTVATPAALREQLADVRRRGHAVEVEEREPGEAGLAVPVRGRGGRVVAAAGITGAVDRLLDRAGRPLPGLLDLLAGCASAVSRELAQA
jgi:DNA-binding IclR family transcriptional regulator